LKRIAVFSDIHGNLEALEAIIKDIDRNNIDEVIYLGDIIGIGPKPKECLDIIMNSRIKMVKGNHEVYQADDFWFNNTTQNEIEHRKWIKGLLNEKELEFIENLPMEIEELINGNLFTFSHFFLNKEKAYFEPLNILGDERIFEVANNTNTDYMFMGHSHDPFQISNHGLFTCVGSSGIRRDNKTFYTIIETLEKSVRITKKVLEYDKNKFEETLKSIDYPDKELIMKSFYGL